VLLSNSGNIEVERELFIPRPTFLLLRASRGYVLGLRAGEITRNKKCMAEED
jgi:hypothetical protein